APTAAQRRDAVRWDVRSPRWHGLGHRYGNGCGPRRPTRSGWGRRRPRRSGRRLGGALAAERADAPPL
ncbi:MAG: hypothetical protein AVDCRST_MAG16-647, partial [uncultured Frankineae bacterium]